jgi:flagellar hook-associated protein FlgK
MKDISNLLSEIPSHILIEELEKRKSEQIPDIIKQMNDLISQMDDLNIDIIYAEQSDVKLQKVDYIKNDNKYEVYFYDEFI